MNYGREQSFDNIDEVEQFILLVDKMHIEILYQ